MKKNAIKTGALILVLLMLFSCFASCKKKGSDNVDSDSQKESATDTSDVLDSTESETDSQNDDGEDGSDSESESDSAESSTESDIDSAESESDLTESETDSTETEAETDDKGYLKDELPETYDFGGVDFRILQWKIGHDFVGGAEATANAINRVKYQSQQAVQKRFNIKIKVHEEHDGWLNDELCTALETSVVANTGMYDMVSHYSDSAGRSITKGYCQDLLPLDYVDFEKPWWAEKLLNSAKIGEKMYYCGGDINGENLMRYMHVTYVNLDMYEEHKIYELVDGRSIYEVVEDGDWTIETFQRMALGTTGNAEDVYGLVMKDYEYADAFLYSGGFSYIKSVNGTLALDENLKSAQITTWHEECQKLLSPGAHVDVKSNDIKPFKEGKALFGGEESLTLAEEMKGNVNFSILPMPKYDHDQEEYYSCCGVTSSLITVPADVKNPEMSGMILEGLASQNHRVVKDVVYYDIFQTRYSSSEDAKGAKMFDIVYNGLVFDVGRVFLRNNFNAFIWRQSIQDPYAQWASTYQKNESAWMSGINKLYADLG